MMTDEKMLSKVYKYSTFLKTIHQRKLKSKQSFFLSLSNQIACSLKIFLGNIQSKVKCPTWSRKIREPQKSTRKLPDRAPPETILELTGRPDRARSNLKNTWCNSPDILWQTGKPEYTHFPLIRNASIRNNQLNSGKLRNGDQLIFYQLKNNFGKFPFLSRKQWQILKNSLKNQHFQNIFFILRNGDHVGCIKSVKNQETALGLILLWVF